MRRGDTDGRRDSRRDAHAAARGSAACGGRSTREKTTEAGLNAATGFLRAESVSFTDESRKENTRRGSADHGDVLRHRSVSSHSSRATSKDESRSLYGSESSGSAKSSHTDRTVVKSTGAIPKVPKQTISAVFTNRSDTDLSVKTDSQSAPGGLHRVHDSVVDKFCDAGLFLCPSSQVSLRSGRQDPEKTEGHSSSSNPIEVRQGSRRSSVGRAPDTSFEDATTRTRNSPQLTAKHPHQSTPDADISNLLSSAELQIQHLRRPAGEQKSQKGNRDVTSSRREQIPEPVNGVARIPRETGRNERGRSAQQKRTLSSPDKHNGPETRGQASQERTGTPSKKRNISADRSARGDRQSRRTSDSVGDEADVQNARRSLSSRRDQRKPGVSSPQRRGTERKRRQDEKKGGQSAKSSQKDRKGDDRRSCLRAEAEEFVPRRRRSSHRENPRSSDWKAEKLPSADHLDTTTKVRIVIHDELRKEKDALEKYLRDFLPASLSFKITDIGPLTTLIKEGEDGEHNKFTVTIELLSLSKAKRVVNIFEKTSHKTNVTLHLAARDAASKEQTQQFLEQQCEDVRCKGDAEMQKHQVKIDELKKQLEKLQTNRRVKTLSGLDSVKLAIRSKIDELVGQKDEFFCHLQQLLQKMSSLETHGSTHNRLKDEVKKLRLDFGQECKKLSTALPIYARRREIIDLVCKNPVSVILGETGSGKSTQLVQYLSQAQSLGWSQLDDSKLIVCTQPRKVAAQSLAEHVATEMASHCGNVVGYKTGLQVKTSSCTNVVFTTDHSLLNECLKDPSLEKYSCVIIDEAHERSIYTDLLLGMIKKCLAYRSDLRVVITSATIDPDVFVRYFNGAPVLRVSGRMFPVDLVYKKPSDPRSEDYLAESVEMVRKIHVTEPEGDVLVFLTSPLETQKACERIAGVPGLKCLSLHGQLQTQEQRLVFEPTPAGIRKVVFATNSAETSITIPGIKYVVDTGKVKEKVFDAKKNMSALVVKSVSKSSAEQRKGRAGRVSAGKCFRLYTEEEFQAMEAISLPEILRVHLGQALLKLMEFGIADPLSFEFVQSPSQDALRSAMKILREVEAVDEDGITQLGKQMAKLPVEPRMAKLIFDSIAQGCPMEGIAVAALNSISGSVFFRMGTAEEKKMADYHKTRFCQPGGDVETFLHVFKEWDAVPEKQKSRWCVGNYINGKSIRACRETIHDIRKILNKELGILIQYRFLQDSDAYQPVLARILLDCFKSNLGYYTRHDRVGYWVVGDKEERFLQMHPSASLCALASSPQWVVFMDVLKTSQNYMLGVITIDKDDVLSQVASGQLTLDYRKLQEVMLVDSVVAEVGHLLMGNVIGPRFQRFKSIQEQLQNIHARPLVLEVNRDKGQIRAFSSVEIVDDIQGFFDDLLEPEKRKLVTEFLEMPVAPNSKTRVEIEAGGKCARVLMPNETRTILLRNVPYDWDENDVRLEFMRFGPISNVIPFKIRDSGNRPWGKDSGNKPWGKVIYSETAFAKSAMENYKEEETGIRVTGEGIGRMTQVKDELKVRIKWCRRPPRDFAFVTPKDPEDAVVINGQSFRINGTDVKARLSKDGNAKLFLSKLAPNTSEDDVKNALGPARILEARIPRVKVDETSPEQLQALTGQMNMRILEFAAKEEFTVRLFPPKAVTFDFTGYILFSNPETGLKAIDKLDGSSFNEQRLLASAELQTSLHVQRLIYQAIQQELTTLMDELTALYSVRINVKELRSGHFVVRLEADKADVMFHARNMLQNLITGHRVEYTSRDEEQALFSFAGRNLLEQLPTYRPGLFIRTDSRLRSVTLYGPQVSIRQGMASINEFLTRFKNLKTLNVPLKGDGPPPGLMKRLLLDYGLEMEELQRATGVEMLSLVLQTHTLKALGTTEALQRLTEVVEESSKKLLEKNVGTLTQGGEVDCLVCFTAIEGRIYRLEYCGHPYCPECVFNLIKNGISSKEFPIVCVSEACGKPLVLKDFSACLGPEEMTNLYKSSLENFVARNSEEFHFCQSPDCPMVYRITRDKGVPLRCDGCGVTLCTKCHVQYHYGLSCSKYQCQLTSDPVLKEWIKKDPQNRAACPKCGAHIEKDGGCMKVHCTKCDVYICWRCMKSFDSSGATYNHLASCGGIF